MARIHIENLGPIKDLSLDVEQFNLLIGEQATGKSTICKAIYFFREVKEVLIDYLYNIAVDGKMDTGFPSVLNSRIKDVFIQLFGYTWNLPLNLKVTYYYIDDVFMSVILVDKGKRYLSLRYSPEMKNKIVSLETVMEQYHFALRNLDTVSGFVSNERIRIHREAEIKISTLLGDSMKTYYIPAGRGLLSLMTNQMTRVNYDSIDLINRRFAQFIEEIQPRFDMGVSGLHKYYPIEKRGFDVAKVSEQIIRNMRGEYFCIKGQEYLETVETKEKIPINFASSGQQEALWLLNRLYVLMLRDEKAFVIIEEPEAHVYPAWQRNLLEFITECMNLTDSTIILTTHSPYFLTAANVLYRGGRIIEKSSELKGKVEKILGKYIYILPEKMRGYKLENQNGVTAATSLIDEDGEELLTELIDEVSDHINRCYTDLYDLEEEYKSLKVV